MVTFVIEIEAVASDPKAVNIVVKSQRDQPAEIEETAAGRLLPALCDLTKARFLKDLNPGE